MIFDNSSQLLRILFQLANSLKISWVRRRMMASIATQKCSEYEAVGQDEQDDKNDTVEPWWTKIIDFLRCKDWWWHMIIMQQVAIMGSGGTDKSRSLRCQDWWDIDDSDASKCQRCQYVKSRTTTAERNVFFESLIFTSEGYFIRF